MQQWRQHNSGVTGLTLIFASNGWPANIATAELWNSRKRRSQSILLSQTAAFLCDDDIRRRAVIYNWSAWVVKFFAVSSRLEFPPVDVFLWWFLPCMGSVALMVFSPDAVSLKAACIHYANIILSILSNPFFILKSEN